MGGAAPSFSLAHARTGPHGKGRVTRSLT